MEEPVKPLPGKPGSVGLGVGSSGKLVLGDVVWYAADAHAANCHAQNTYKSTQYKAKIF